MLKFTYTETGLYLEHLTQSLEKWMVLRVVLSLRLSQRLVIERCTASFLLRADLAELYALEAAIALEATITPCDHEYIEICLWGTWVTSRPDQSEGVFVATLSDRNEFLLFKLWQESQTCASSLGR
jgi:hypothetical protein